MKVKIKGPIIDDSEQIVYDWFKIPATSPSKIIKSIDKATEKNIKELTVTINSGGGSIFAASEIYTELKKFDGNIKIEIVGVSASAASVIAMAGEVIAISPTAQIMIHNTTTKVFGDYREMDRASSLLQKINLSIMNAYTEKTGKNSTELKKMMDEETWMTAQEAKRMGFVDLIMFESESEAVASKNSELINGVLPKEVLNRIREKYPHKQNKNLGGVKPMNLNTGETKETKEHLINEILKATGLGKEEVKQAGLQEFKEGNDSVENFANKILEEMGMLKND